MIFCFILQLYQCIRSSEIKIFNMHVKEASIIYLMKKKVFKYFYFFNFFLAIFAVLYKNRFFILLCFMIKGLLKTSSSLYITQYHILIIIIKL